MIDFNNVLSFYTITNFKIANKLTVGGHIVKNVNL